MNIKNLKLFSILMLSLLFSVAIAGTVSATDVGSFSELNHEIQSGNNNITLEHDISVTDNDINCIGSGGIIIYNNVTIDGHGYCIDGNHQSSFFYVFQDASLTLINITLKNGQTYYSGGAIDSQGTLKVINSKFINNKSGNDGGAICQIRGQCTIINSTFNNNQAKYCGGAIDGDGCTIINSTFNNNQAERGGATSGSGCTIINSTFNNNQAKYEGGAIYRSSTIINSTFNNNQANHDGGAIYNEHVDNSKIINSTFNNNQAKDCGGAIYNSCGRNDTVINCIFNENKANDAGAIYNLCGPNFKVMNSQFTNNKIHDFNENHLITLIDNIYN